MNSPYPGGFCHLGTFTLKLQSIDFLKFLLQSDNKLLVSEMLKSGVHRFRFRLKACHLIQLDLHGFRVKMIEVESREANDLSQIL